VDIYFWTRLYILLFKYNSISFKQMSIRKKYFNFIQLKTKAGDFLQIFLSFYGIRKKIVKLRSERSGTKRVSPKAFCLHRQSACACSDSAPDPNLLRWVEAMNTMHWLAAIAVHVILCRYRSSWLPWKPCALLRGILIGYLSGCS
jgi:hypothetical protein